ncbi:MAG: phosphodiester glycosidase family protein [Clostridia bacterium]|nr:phosphodiester glycosidase family protein [Clostridia bacterium]
MKRIFAAVLFALLLPALAAAQVNPLPMDLSGGMAVNEANYLSDTVYEDESLRVDIEVREVDNTRVCIARVKIADPSQLRTAPAYTFERDQTAPVKTIAERVNAVLAINGDYFSFQQFVSGGGYLVRQGHLYHEKALYGREVLIIDENGDFFIEKKIDKDVLARYDSHRIVNSFNFGPGLVIDGEVLTNYKAKYNSAQKKTQRCGIAQVKRGELEYLCVVTEGEGQKAGGGMTMEEFAQFMYSLGVENAYNLDGGHSTAMIFRGEKLNAVNNADHRPLSDIIYFASAVSEE